MDGVRLIAISRDALAQSVPELDTMVEAWQAQALAQAVGGHLALRGPQELRAEARALGESGGRGCGALEVPALRGGLIRAAQLSEVSDVREALTALGVLLGEVGIALVGVACGTEEEGVYWQCIEAMDAADESGDRVSGMLRRLDERDGERAWH
ncbi:DUF6099 family protein [Streptomyces sp. NBC_01267]|uniref:DUF6099 family protein n=1 Tax=unclassified Streptomyces TaxID=2593676 RepID=UPI0020254D5A|nr:MULTISPECIES: DUF6099 family protein [unclassified Streptomyces]MCX4547542.1 DUF6099 family protein [Streptomyces sp. NBC_01500]WSC19230.1 DUF6099 family protein [Streptomyces sp. NBC_01766]WSV53253.1 DUF6099 family protein [Streptomyces sp. NBC_01014]